MIYTNTISNFEAITSWTTSYHSVSTCCLDTMLKNFQLPLSICLALLLPTFSVVVVAWFVTNLYVQLLYTVLLNVTTAMLFSSGQWSGWRKSQVSEGSGFSKARPSWSSLSGCSEVCPAGAQKQSFPGSPQTPGSTDPAEGDKICFFRLEWGVIQVWYC